MALATPVIVFAVNPNGKIIACHALYNGKYSCLTASFSAQYRIRFPVPKCVSICYLRWPPINGFPFDTLRKPWLSARMPI
jgi:hypothetical protein